MTQKEARIRSALAGEKAEIQPFSLWTHFPEIDMDPTALAEHTYRFYKDFDLDFIKNMPNGMFSVEDWGCACDYSAIPKGGVAEVTRFAVESPKDWNFLSRPKPGEGAMGRELKSLRMLAELTKGEVPIVATIFSPVTTAEKLSGIPLADSVLENPKGFKDALGAIAEVTAEFALQAVESGCSGVYFASQVSSLQASTRDFYQEFGVPFDRNVLTALPEEAWFNVMHLHGDDIMFDLTKDYPVQAISWHVWETAPSLEEFLRQAPDRCIVGGLRRFRITAGDRKALDQDIRLTLEATGRRRVILAPGCVIRYPFDTATLRHVRDSIRR